MSIRRAVAIVREEPIVGRLQDQTGCGQDGFMPSAANLEEKAILALQLNLAIVQTARHEHSAIDADQRFALEALVFRRVVVR
jgi:hypothetical protein